MHRFRKILLGSILGIAMLAQNASLMMNPDVKRVGMKLACLCGACKNSVGDCPMIGCHYAVPAREQIDQMQKANMEDQAIVDKFIEQQGIKALVVPPAEGFNLAVWVMPGVMIFLGLMVIYFYIQRLRKPAATGTAHVSTHYNELAAKDLDKLD